MHRRLALGIALAMTVAPLAHGASGEVAPGSRAAADALARRADATSPGAALTNALTRLARARFVLDRYPPVPAVTNFVARELAAAAAWLDGADRDVPPPRGEAIEGYHSDVDDSFQPFVRYLPVAGAEEGDAPLPLLVYLHGYFPEMNIINWTVFPSNLFSTAEALGFAVAAPFARGNTDFQGVGEQDVLRVIDEMQARYPIDPNRVILVGFSMGGMGAYTVAGHHPHRFAAAVAVSARGDYYHWHGVDAAELPAWQRYLIDADFGHGLRGNLAMLPLWVAYGALDLTVPAHESRHMADLLDGTHDMLRRTEFEDHGHYVFDPLFAREAFREWLSAQRRFERHEASNPPAFDPDRGRYRWQPDRDTFRSLASATPAPFKQAHLAPFVYVQAAPPGGAPSAADERLFDRAVRDWMTYAHAAPRMADERSLDPSMLSAHNVFLFGPADSDLVRQVLAESLVRAEGDTFRVGDQTYPAEGRGLIVVRPSPWHPGRLAVVCLGAPWGAGLPSNHVYDFIPDYIVFEGLDFEPDGRNRAVAAGFFPLAP